MSSHPPSGPNAFLGNPLVKDVLTLTSVCGESK
jgi:hypothetical protein